VFVVSSPHPARALVFANGELNDGPAVRAALAAAPDARVIAADGGTRLALELGLTPHLVVGDMDSIAPQALATLAVQRVEFIRAPAMKNETDLELALLAAVEGGATWLRVLGAVGGRIDQTLANVYLLSLPQLQGRDARLVSGAQTLWLIGPGEHAIEGKRDDTVSLIPAGGDAQGVRTEGLRYILHNETLRFGPARGVSNVLLGDRAAVALESGRLIVVHTPGRA